MSFKPTHFGFLVRENEDLSSTGAEFCLYRSTSRYWINSGGVKYRKSDGSRVPMEQVPPLVLIEVHPISDLWYWIVEGTTKAGGKIRLKVVAHTEEFAEIRCIREYKKLHLIDDVCLLEQFRFDVPILRVTTQPV